MFIALILCFVAGYVFGELVCARYNDQYLSKLIKHHKNNYEKAAKDFLAGEKPWKLKNL